MDSKDLCFLSAQKLAALIRQKEISPREVMDTILTRIEKINPKVNAYCTVVPEMAREAARKAEEKVMGGEDPGPLHGVPFSVKDLTLTAGVRTTYGSKIFEHFVPQEDALIVERLKKAGGILIGKTNTPEFGAGANTYNAVFGPTRNPWKLTHTCGGSSGGAAVALACGLGPLATGSDLGGSLRIPAAFCGVVGFRTTPGLIPIYPSILAYDNLGVEGPMARTVGDTALMLSVIAGEDARAPISFPVDTQGFLSAVSSPDIRGLKVAWSPDLNILPVDQEVQSVVAKAAQRYGELGCRVERAEPDLRGVREVIYVTRSLRMLAHHGDKLDKWREKMNPNLVWNIEQGFTLTPRRIAEAEKERTNIYRRVQDFFSRFDLLLTPTVAVSPFPVEMSYPQEINGKPMDNYTDWLLMTYAITITGYPAISIPCGFTKEGFPVGLQIVGRKMAEATVLKAAAAFEAAAPWQTKYPPAAIA